MARSSRTDMRILDDYHEIFIIGLVVQQSIYMNHAKQYTMQQMCKSRVLKRYGFTRKQVQRVALQISTVVRASFMADMFLYNCASFVWIDETGSDRRNFLRKYGYGERAIKHTFLLRGKRINAILAISSWYSVQIQDTIDTNKFYDFVRGDLLPSLQPFDGLATHSMIIDNFQFITVNMCFQY